MESSGSGLGSVLQPAGRYWDVLLVPGELGRITFSLLAGLPGRQGPAYEDFGDGYLGFLVPVGTAARWVGTGVRVAGAGTWIALPRDPGRWLVPPDRSGKLNDPVLLELALHEAAALLYSVGPPDAVPDDL